MKWVDAVEILRARRTESQELSDGVIQFEYKVPNPQLVFLDHIWFGDPHPHVAKISAPIGYLDNLDLLALTQLVGLKMVGGIYTQNNIVYVVNSVMLDNTDLTGLQNTMVLTAVVAQSMQP